jgi:hypothetical protein
VEDGDEDFDIGEDRDDQEQPSVQYTKPQIHLGPEEEVEQVQPQKQQQQSISQMVQNNQQQNNFSNENSVKTMTTTTNNNADIIILAEAETTAQRTDNATFYTPC